MSAGENSHLNQSPSQPTELGRHKQCVSQLSVRPFFDLPPSKSIYFISDCSGGHGSPWLSMAPGTHSSSESALWTHATCGWSLGMGQDASSHYTVPDTAVNHGPYRDHQLWHRPGPGVQYLVCCCHESVVSAKLAIPIDFFPACLLQKDSQGSSKLTTGQIRGIADLCLLLLPLHLKHPLQKRPSHGF